MRPWFLLLVLLLSLSAQPARAQGRVESVCAEQQPTALVQTACELARALPRPARPLVVVASRITTSAPADASDRLAFRLAQLVAGALGPTARAHPTLLDAAAAARLARSGTDIVVLSAQLSRDRWSVSADLLQAPEKFWDRFRPNARGIAAHAHAARALDAELREYLPKVPLVLTRVDRSTLPDEAPVALGCGDLDGDGALEIVSVGRRRIQLGRIEHGAFEVLKSASWSELSEISPRPLREPIASVTFISGRLEVGITDRADALRLDAALKPLERYPARLPWPGGGCAAITTTGIELARGACNGKSGGARTVVDAIAGYTVMRRDGTRVEMSAWRDTERRLGLQIGARTLAASAIIGAQLALADLNGDATPELLTSVDTLDAASDALIVQSVGEDGALKPAFRVPVASGVRAIAVCPSEGALLAPIVVASGDSLLVLR